MLFHDPLSKSKGWDQDLKKFRLTEQCYSEITNYLNLAELDSHDHLLHSL